jgi:hypothetical protein
MRVTRPPSLRPCRFEKSIVAFTFNFNFFFFFLIQMGKKGYKGTFNFNLLSFNKVDIPCLKDKFDPTTF